MFNFPAYKRDANQRFHLTPVRMAILRGSNNNTKERMCTGQIRKGKET
jgi:hypothetical protein